MVYTSVQTNDRPMLFYHKLSGLTHIRYQESNKQTAFLIFPSKASHHGPLEIILPREGI
jgi:hypothetical protein